MQITYATLLNSEKKPKKKGFKLTCATVMGQIITLHTYKDYSNIVSPKCVYQVSYVSNQYNEYSSVYESLVGDPAYICAIDEELDMIRRDEMTEYLKTKGQLVAVGTTFFKKMEMASTDYLVNHRCLKKSHAVSELWDRIEPNKPDIESIYTKVETDRFGHSTMVNVGRGTEFLPTYNEKYIKRPKDKTKDLSENNNKEFVKDMDSVTKPYSNKSKYYTITGTLEESELTKDACLDTVPGTTYIDDKTGDESEIPDVTVNNFEKTGVNAQLDSIFGQVCLREGLTREFYIYFLLVTYMKQSRRFPNANINDCKKFLNKYLPRTSTLGRMDKTKLLHKLAKKGFIQIGEGKEDPNQVKSKRKFLGNNSDKVSIISQKTIVEKYSARWLSKQEKATAGKIKKLYNYDQNTVLGLENERGEALTFDQAQAITGTYKPYFDIAYAKTIKIDSGFINLLHSSLSDQKAFLYETIVSSWDEDACFCRTRIAQNLLIRPSTQIMYERRSTYLSKRYNHTEMTKDLMQTWSIPMQKHIKNISHTGSRFKKSLSGKIYRQEGNTYSSDRLVWKLSKKCSKIIRLSPYHIQLYKAGQPVFKVPFDKNGKLDTKADTFTGKNKINDPVVFMKVLDKLLNAIEKIEKGQPVYRTHISKKKDLTDHTYFAIQKNGVGIPTIDPEGWKGYQPLAELDKKTGDLLMPAQQAYWVTINSKKERLKTYSARDCVSLSDDRHTITVLPIGNKGKVLPEEIRNKSSRVKSMYVPENKLTSNVKKENCCTLEKYCPQVELPKIMHPPSVDPNYHKESPEERAEFLKQVEEGKKGTRYSSKNPFNLKYNKETSNVSNSNKEVLTSTIFE